MSVTNTPYSDHEASKFKPRPSAARTVAFHAFPPAGRGASAHTTRPAPASTLRSPPPLPRLAVTSERHTKPQPRADGLGMTVQGASDYVRRMTADGLRQVVDGEYRATRRGVEFLQGRFLELRALVDRAGQASALLQTT